MIHFEITFISFSLFQYFQLLNVVAIYFEFLLLLFETHLLSNKLAKIPQIQHSNRNWEKMKEHTIEQSKENRIMKTVKE